MMQQGLKKDDIAISAWIKSIIDTQPVIRKAKALDLDFNPRIRSFSLRSSSKKIKEKNLDKESALPVPEYMKKQEHDF